VPMVQLSAFDTDSLPEAHEHQIRSFIRLHWHDQYQYAFDGPLVPAERHATHLVVHERHALFSHGRIIWVELEHQGHRFRFYCLGDVLTYPAFRRRGFGGQIVETGTNLIRNAPLADAAILFTGIAATPFYAAHGWETMPTLRASYGHPTAAEPAQGTAMMLFVSERAKRQRKAFETQELRLPGWGW
jgi:GNAT superfamily N-acetyltransferase